MMSTILLAALLIGPTPGAPLDSVVASVGRFTITVGDLIDSYEFGPAFVKRMENPLERHLEYMIYERLIALDAERLGYDTSVFVRDRARGLEEDLAVEQLYREEILSKITLTSEEIEEATTKAQIQLRLRWLYAADRAEAERLQTLLASGVPFDSLFLYQKVVTEESERQLETNVLRLERDNARFARTIRDLRSQETSTYIEGPDGFYLVRVDEIWRNPLVTEFGQAVAELEATKMLRAIRANEMADNYVRTLMASANPVIKAEGFNIVRAYLADKGLSSNTRLKWQIPETFMTEAGPLPLAASAELLRRPLVTFGNRTFTVRDYIHWFDLRQFQLKTHSLAAFNASVKRTIWKMVQDKLLSGEAYRRGMHLQPAVAHEAKKWETKLLYLAGRRHASTAIRVSDEEVKQRFQDRRHLYRKPDGMPMEFDEAQQGVWAELYNEHEVHNLFRLIQRLLNEFPVSINEKLLTKLSETVERDPQAIEVIFYKPGGTFPRVAFPTIDERWQRFR